MTLDYGLHKLVFKLEIETGVPGLPLYKTAYTYFNITKSPLIPAFIKGSVAKVNFSENTASEDILVKY